MEGMITIERKSILRWEVRGCTAQDAKWIEALVELLSAVRTVEIERDSALPEKFLQDNLEELRSDPASPQALRKVLEGALKKYVHLHLKENSKLPPRTEKQSTPELS